MDFASIQRLKSIVREIARLNDVTTHAVEIA